jgi:hypothetical protein
MQVKIYKIMNSDSKTCLNIGNDNDERKGVRRKNYTDSTSVQGYRRILYSKQAEKVAVEVW